MVKACTDLGNDSNLIEYSIKYHALPFLILGMALV